MHQASSLFIGKINNAKKPKEVKQDGYNRRRQKQRKRTILIGTWNIQGIRNKMVDILEEIKRLNQDIIILTETKKKGCGSEVQGDYLHFYSGVEKHKRAQRGVSILIKKRFKRCINNWEAINENIIKMDVNMFGRKVTIVGVYGISEDERSQKKDEFYEILNNVVNEIGNSREIILAGDWNGRTGKQNGNEVVGPFGEETVNDNGERIIELCEQYLLKITNGFYEHKEIHKFTRHQDTLQQRSIIDYIIVRQKTGMIVQDVRAFRGPNCGSDHYLVNSKIWFPFHKNIEDNSNKNDSLEASERLNVPVYNIQSLNDDSTVYLYQQRLDAKLMESNFDTTEKQFQYIVENMRMAAMEALGEYQIENKKPYYWNKDIKHYIEEKREKYLKWLNTKSLTDKMEYKKAQANVRKRVTEQKNQYWEQTCKRIQSYIGGKRCSEAWRVLKNLRSKGCNKISIQGIPLNEWKAYFENLLTEDRPEFLEKTEEVEVEENRDIITLDLITVEMAISSLKNGTACGEGGIQVELIKCGTRKLFELLRNLFERCLNGEEVPQQWKIGLISVIHKKGKKNECNNYRGITVMNIFSRLYGKIIKYYLEEEYKNKEYEIQAGFRSGRSTVDNVFVVKQLIEKTNYMKQQVHFSFVDLEKAYDTVPLNKLWEALNDMEIDKRITSAIKELYKDAESKVKIGKTMSKGIKVTKGLRQGCSMSPTLFKIYLHRTILDWLSKCSGMGIPVGNDSIYTLLFADDQVVISQDYEDMEYMLRKLLEEYEKWGLKVNLDKTFYMGCGNKTEDLILEDQKGFIKGCEEFDYLGVRIDKEDRQESDIKNRINKVRATIAMLNSILWDRNITKEVKLQITYAIQ